ncbi:MAG: hypothetical protein J0I06_04930 [Planctomycetes bacterium]|nr:hypothetical protein [Planctomycetota bacterium]
MPSASQVANNPQLLRFTTADQIPVKASPPEAVPATVGQVNELLRQRHPARYEDDFSARDMSKI